MYVLRWGRRCARISRRGAAPTTLLCSSTMTTISSAALITVLASLADNGPKKGCHRIMPMPSYHTRLFQCLAKVGMGEQRGGGDPLEPSRQSLCRPLLGVGVKTSGDIAYAQTLENSGYW